MQAPHSDGEIAWQPTQQLLCFRSFCPATLVCIEVDSGNRFGKDIIFMHGERSETSEGNDEILTFFDGRITFGEESLTSGVFSPWPPE